MGQKHQLMTSNLQFVAFRPFAALEQSIFEYIPLENSCPMHNSSLNSNLKVLVIDTEMETVIQTISYLRELGFTQIKTETNAFAALQLVKVWKPDFVLLDTELNGENTGITIGKTLTEEFNIPFMYVASDFQMDLVKQIMDTKPNGYVMKPMNKSQFIVALNILLLRLADNQHAIISEKKNGGKLVWEKDIIYFQASGNYWEVVTPKGKTLMRKTVAEIMGDLHENQYLRIHRSYIVKRTAVRKFSSSKVSLVNGLTLPISRSFQHELRNIS